MKTIFFFCVLAFINFFIRPGEPISSVEVFLEQEGNKSPIAFLQTGDNGKATFSNLSRGIYRIKVVLPQQSGKLMRNKNSVDCQLMVGYHNDKQEYFLREDEGFFTVCYSNLKRVSNKSITPVYNLELEKRSKTVEIGKFEINGNNGSFTMEVRAHKPGMFVKMVERLRNDVGMVTIKNAG